MGNKFEKPNRNSSGTKPTRFESAILAIVIAIISFQLFIPPRIGMADNGDFDRVLPQSGLAPATTVYGDRYWHYFHLKYPIIATGSEPYWYLTSTFLLIKPARWSSLVIGQNAFFDIRLLAMFYILLLVVGLSLIVIATRPLRPASRVILCVLLVAMFTDAGYVAYFNSFYSESTALVFLTIAIGSSLILISGQSSNISFLILYFLASALFITSKPMYVTLVPALVIFGIFLSRRLQYVRRYWLSGALAIILCLVSGFYYWTVPEIMKTTGPYIGIFLDLLPNSSNPRQDLIEFGLDPNLVAFIGKNPYPPDTPLNAPPYKDEIRAKLNGFTLPAFYLRHPVRFYNLCSRCVKYIFSTRVSRTGYYEANSGKDSKALPFGIWSVVREHVFPRTLFFLGLFFATSVPAATLLVRSFSPFRDLYFLYLLFVFIAGVQFLVAIVSGGGEPDVEKHLFMFNFAFDSCLILVILGVLYLARNLLVRRRSRRLISRTSELAASAIA